MFVQRIFLLLFVLSFVAAHPVESPVKSQESPGIDLGDYPDLTKGLTDAEVESSLNGLTLEDLDALDKLLDDTGNGPIDFEASLRGHHRQANRKHHYDELETGDEELDSAFNSGKHAVDDGCHDEDDQDKERDLCTERPKCNKQPSCATTKRCTSTRRCFTKSCKNSNDFFDINLDDSKYSQGRANHAKFRRPNFKGLEVCDPEDTMCLERNRGKIKQRPNLQDFHDLNVDQDQDNMDSLEKLAAEAQQDESMKLRKQFDNWHSKDEPSQDMFILDQYKLPNIDTGGNINELKEFPKLSNVAEDESQPAQNEEEAKQLEMDMPYERHQLARVAHERARQQEKAAVVDGNKQQPEELDNTAVDENMSKQREAAPDFQEFIPENYEAEAVEPLPLGNMEANDDDSFIAKNAREPLRYLIQTDDGLISSENEPGEHKLRSDKRHSEMLNYATYQLSNNNNDNLNQEEMMQYKRYKRDSKKTDDAPENSKESYLKKLMDSFPRDQGERSNLKMAIREANRAHFRVKRS